MDNEGVREQEDDGEGQEAQTCTDKLCVSGTTTPSEMAIYKCKSLLTNLRKSLNHGIDYSGVTLFLFLFFFFFKPNNPKAQRLSGLFLAEQKCITDILTFCEK